MRCGARLTCVTLLQAEDALYGKRYEVAGGPGEQQQYSQPGQEMLEGIKVEERLVNSILNDTHSILADMFQQDGGDSAHWFPDMKEPPVQGGTQSKPASPAPNLPQGEEREEESKPGAQLSLLRQALISKRTKNKSNPDNVTAMSQVGGLNQPLSTISQCNSTSSPNFLPTFKMEPMNKLNGNSDFLDLDSLVYNEIDKHSASKVENNNEPESGVEQQPNTAKLLHSLARGLSLPHPAVSLPTCPLPPNQGKYSSPEANNIASSVFSVPPAGQRRPGDPARAERGGEAGAAGDGPAVHRHPAAHLQHPRGNGGDRPPPAQGRL